LLIAEGANVNFATYSEFYTALMIASYHGHADIVRILLEHGANVNAEDDYNATAITRAAESGYLEIVRLLVAHGANTSIREESDLTALELAESRGHHEVASFLRTYPRS
jgi:ankyrin repeat protein